MGSCSVSGKRLSALLLPHPQPAGIASEAGSALFWGAASSPPFGLTVYPEDPLPRLAGLWDACEEGAVVFQNISLQESGMLLNNLLWIDREFI